MRHGICCAGWLALTVGAAFAQTTASPAQAASPAFDVASVCALIFLIGLVLWTFQDYSISNDEGVQNQYGELIVA